MKTIYAFLAALLSAGQALNAQTPYRTQVFEHKHIKSLQILQPDQTFSIPVLALNSDAQLEFVFDDFLNAHSRYAYSIIHCDADWQPSDLSPIEYLDGFQDLTIDDFANSMATTTQYTNYRLFLPNDDIQFKVSGNYVLKVYPEDDPERIVLTACFQVVEPQIQISAEVTGNTNIDTYQRHQQVNFVLNTKNFQIAYPQSDIKICVTQNNRTDNAVTNIKPSGILDGQIIYENIPELIFPAGNEYRRMEFLSNKYNGMRVENISFHNPFYHVTLLKDFPSAMSSYEYDQDQNGRFYVNSSGSTDPDTEADYYFVHFTLAMPESKQGKVYLNGEAFHNLFNEETEMSFNHETNQYEKSILLKQGNYNYQYLYVPNGETKGRTDAIEGDFHQTENEYCIYVYYRPMGARYDRLIGVSSISNLREKQLQ